MKKLRKPFFFSLAVMPVSVAAIWFTVMYQFDLYDETIVQQMIAQIGSMNLVILITMVQNCILIFFSCFLGCILAEKAGLLRPFTIKSKTLATTGILALAGGVIIALDYWTFGAAESLIRESTAAGMTICGIIASILYGGIVEEILLRLFVMSLIARIIRRLFYRRAEGCPQGALIAANIVAAVLFAAGHLPVTLITFGSLTPLLLFRCFLLNGGLGLMFGWLYRKHGIQYSMIAHAGVHVVSKLIWLLAV